MKRITLLLCAVFLAAACNQNPSAVISATFEGAADSTVVLQKLNFNKLVPVDTLRTDDSGHLDYKVSLTGNDPYFYYLYIGDRPAVSMILRPGDRVSIRVSSTGGFTIEGSEESSLLKEVDERYAAASNAVMSLLSTIDENSSESDISEVNRQISRSYVEYKREAIKYVMEHPKSITSALVLFQRLGDELPVFSQQSDVILFRTVQDSLATVYPRSEFLTALRDEISSRSGEMALSMRLENVDEISFPEIAMPDIDGNMRSLSELKGKVFILSFWTVGQTEHKMFNVDLAEIYSKYHSRGLEIYQVSLDIDKPSWAATVRNQNLPWINVNDGLGTQSQSVKAYNVNYVPTMFVFDKNGDIAGSDVFDKNALDQLVRRLL